MGVVVVTKDVVVVTMGVVVVTMGVVVETQQHQHTYGKELKHNQ